jgi:hypothetical protein
MTGSNGVMPRYYVRVLATILLAYAVIIGLGDTTVGGPGRLLVLGFLLTEALRLSEPGSLWQRRAAWFGTAFIFLAAIAASAAAPAPVASGLIGGVSLVLTGSVIAILVRSLRARNRLDTQTVVGVLAVYLLLALLYASVHQLLAAFNPDGYLHGVTGLPTASDQLYFSVITLTTVGYGDIVPASDAARAVVVVEALTGQVYLVSVVAAVVGGWRRGDR